MLFKLKAYALVTQTHNAIHFSVSHLFLCLAFLFSVYFRFKTGFTVLNAMLCLDNKVSRYVFCVASLTLGSLRTVPPNTDVFLQTL